MTTHQEDFTDDNNGSDRLAESPWKGLFKIHPSAVHFWRSVLEAACKLVDGQGAWLFIRRVDGESVSWQRAGVFPDSPGVGLANDEIIALSRGAFEQGYSSLIGAGRKQPLRAAIRLDTDDGEPDAIVVVSIDSNKQATPDETVTRLLPIVDIPFLFKLQSQVGQSENDVRRVASVLDLVILLNKETRYVSAAMRVCNEIAAKQGYSRVYLGWKVNEEMRLQAVSHSEKFEKKMELVRRLEGAMEECLDQDEEIVWPAEDNLHTITREHHEYGSMANSGCVISVPIRLERDIVGILVCERDEKTQAPDSEVDQLRLYADQISRRLVDLYQTGRPIHKRVYAHFREQAAAFIGARYTGWKLAGISMAVIMLLLILVRTPYRVEAPFELRGESTVFVTAPFEGYLKDVAADVGDRINEGDLLARFDKRELILSETNALAEYTRYLGESEKARAEKNFADMRIFQAKAEELEAQIALIRRKLDQADIRAPLTGEVIEGDLKEQIGAPFTKGETLFRITEIGSMFIEASVDERDIDELATAEGIEIAFSSRPDVTINARLTRVDPIALPMESGNVFRVKCEFDEDIPEWCRPGMTGVAKIETESRSLLWIISHRTLDFLRLYLWW